MIILKNTIYIRKEKDNYYLTYKNFKEICYIGKNGLTNNKKEGDYKTPIGVFNLGIAFGINKNEINNTFEYIEINNNLYWVDDPKSIYYNKLVDIEKVKKDWNSAEHLIDYPKAYEYAIEIKTNPENIKGNGSAIFLHIKDKNYTAGCISLSKENLLKLLKIINRNTKIDIR